MANFINYGVLMHRAMRSLMRELLTEVGKNGLPGDHHFFITFDTRHPQVEMAGWLHDRYPEEMTLVIQNWFENLTVADDHFTITLNFGNNPEPMIIPLESVLTFVDPSVEFGLRFEDQEQAETAEDIPESPMVELDGTEEDEEDEKEAPKGDAEVVSLDSFRK